jgi:hypothetical protein
MKIICIKSHYGVNLPLNTQISIDSHNMEVCGIAKQEYKDGLLYQYWIVEEKKDWRMTANVNKKN